MAQALIKPRTEPPLVVLRNSAHKPRERFPVLARGRRKLAAAFLLAIVTLGSGLVDLFSVMGGPTHPHFLKEIFPIEFIGFSRTLTLLIGFALVVSSLNILKRKRRAWAIVVALASASVISHLFKGLDYPEAAISFGLVLVLLLARKLFSVRSSMPSIRDTAMRLLLSAHWRLDTVLLDSGFLISTTSG